MEESQIIDELTNVCLSVKECAQLLGTRKDDMKLTNTIRFSFSHLSSPPLPVTLPKGFVSVRDSNIHGRGVFADMPIEKNKVITFYPCHAIREHVSGKVYASKLPIPTTQDHCRRYNVHLKEFEENATHRFSIVGNPDILPDDGSFVGHMINDPCKNIEEFDCDILKLPPGEFAKRFMRYMIQSGKETNCIIVPTPFFVYVKTTRDVGEDEELKTSYGVPYWCYQNDTGSILRHLERDVSNFSVKRQAIMKEIILLSNEGRV